MQNNSSITIKESTLALELTHLNGTIGKTITIPPRRNRRYNFTTNSWEDYVPQLSPSPVPLAYWT